MISAEDLRSSHAFVDLPAEELESIAARAADVMVETGAWLIHEGELPSFFVLIAGRLTVLKSRGGVDEQINEMWQSDFIHWHLADGTQVEILNWLDDHSRYLLSATAHQPVTGDVIVAEFLATVERYGPPASTLTDNGSVYTSRFTGGRNAFEYVLPLLGVRQKNGSPGHPQTQGKTERFHQTQQRWLRARPAAGSLAQLQRQLDQFRSHYNEQRPHRALDRRTPGTAYRATPRALPASNGHPPGHYRLRYDRLDTTGKMSLRRAGRMHHLGVGAAHARKRVLALADDHHITVIELDTGEILSRHKIEPEKTASRRAAPARRSARPTGSPRSTPAPPASSAGTSNPPVIVVDIDLLSIDAYTEDRTLPFGAAPVQTTLLGLV